MHTIRRLIQSSVKAGVEKSGHLATESVCLLTSHTSLGIVSSDYKSFQPIREQNEVINTDIPDEKHSHTLPRRGLCCPQSPA